MTISLQYGLVINIFLVALLVLLVLIGYKKGFLIQLVDLLGQIASLFMSWLLSKALGGIIPIIPGSFVPFQKTILDGFFYKFVNSTLWFIVLFIIFWIVMKIVKMLVKRIDLIPILGKINKALGVLLALVRYAIFVVIALFVLASPLFKNGTEVIENSWLKYGQMALNQVTILGENPLTGLTAFKELEVLQDFINDPKQLSETQLQAVMGWLSGQGISADQIGTFLSEIMK